jgi:septal ring factor EnvC (AmiA/AmiB activator)
MRTGLRQVTISEAQLRNKLTAQEAEIASFIAALQSMSRGPVPTTLLHPDGATGSARAAMLLVELTPALHQKAEALRADLEQVETLRALQVDATSRMQTALGEVQSARTALNQAMANRTDLPRRFTADPVRIELLVASSDTLEGFAGGLSEFAIEEISTPQHELKEAKGHLPLPARGLILRRANEADAAGVVRPGIIVATRPGALVTAPAAATIRYAGPLLDFGSVMILEPENAMLFVIAGLDQVYGEPGQVIAAGTPLGLMGGLSQEELSPLREDTGSDLTETLYIEVRQNNMPQDPERWFRTDKDE